MYVSSCDQSNKAILSFFQGSEVVEGEHVTNTCTRTPPSIDYSLHDTVYSVSAVVLLCQSSILSLSVTIQQHNNRSKQQ